jgi:TIR domain
MDVLISWSGKQSRAVAETLYEWLPKVIPSIRPWLSTQDIDKGRRWSNELQNYLSTAKGCIVCITPENLNSPWVYWETGAIALTQPNPICPLLINVTPDDIQNGPLVQFQCTYSTRDDVLHLVQSLNQRLDSPEDGLMVRGRFDTHWEQLQRTLSGVASMGIPKNVLAVIRGLEDIGERFRRRWETDKKAESWDPIKQLTSESAAMIDR